MTGGSNAPDALLYTPGGNKIFSLSLSPFLSLPPSLPLFLSLALFLSLPPSLSPSLPPSLPPSLSLPLCV